MDAKERSAVSRRRSCERLEVLGSSEVVGRKPSLQLLLSSNCFHFAYFNTNPKLIRPCECDEGNTFVKLVPLLEGCSSCRLALLILWSLINKCMINCKLEGLNRCTCYALVVPNLESRKCISVVDLDFDYDSQQTLKCTAKEVEIQDLPPPLITMTKHCLHMMVLELVVRALTMWHMVWNPHWWVLNIC